MNVAHILMTLLLASAGGVVCWWLQTPLPWMIGAMTVVTAAALYGLPVRSLHPLRMAMVTILGVMLGSSFTPALFSQLGAWPLPLSGLLVYCAATLGAGVLYFRYVAGVDVTTSFFSAAPGGLNEMTIVGTQMGGDERIISLTHAVRILIAVFTIPIWFRIFMDYSPAARAAANVGMLEVPVLELAKLGACAVIGGILGKRLRLPAWQVLGPMIASAAAHMTGLTAARPPIELISAAQVVMGVGVGCRFAGTRLSEVRTAILHAMVFAGITIAIAVLSATVLHQLTGLPIAALVLAYAPGGLAEMSLVALALSIDIAFVATHHAFRLLIVLAITPPIFRRLRRTKT
ncbi:MAG: AbrB family transcriptional regulator [Alphaproteobacteria bacterium]|nr:AbrB family transcriptional regulator [Alphaproteobacteria bacterium]